MRDRERGRKIERGREKEGDSEREREKIESIIRENVD